MIKSRALRGRVDRNLPFGVITCRFHSRALRGRVDRNFEVLDFVFHRAGRALRGRVDRNVSAFGDTHWRRRSRPSRARG